MYRCGADGVPGFIEAGAPTDDELDTLQYTIIARLMKTLTRRGVLVEDMGQTYPAEPDADGDRGLMMFGIVNNISSKSAKAAEKAQAQGAILDAAELANMQLFHRTQKNKDVIDGAHFSKETVPQGFEPELTIFPGDEAQDFGAVVIHSKFVVIDAEGDKPIIYTGSANMSENSEHNIDENLIELQDPRVAAVYLAEFMRLYEHYRARAIAINDAGKPADKRPSRAAADAQVGRQVLQRRKSGSEGAHRDGARACRPALEGSPKPMSGRLGQRASE